MKRIFLYFSIALLAILASCSDSDLWPDLGGGKKIYYTTIDGKKVQFGPFSGSFDAVLVSNTYENGKGCLTFDEKVTVIGDYAFVECENLASITIPESVVSIGESVFASGDNLSEFRGKYASKDGRCLIIDGTLNYFAPAGLKSYNIPEGVSSIGESAFSYCSSLASITIPDSVTSIESWAFYECSSLTSVTIGDGVTLIGEYAFSYCSSLTSITIPDSVTSIGESAFYDCLSLSSVYCKPTIPPTGGDDMFSCTNGGRWPLGPIGCKIYVSRNSVGAYRSAGYWSEYADDIVGYNFNE